MTQPVRRRTGVRWIPALSLLAALAIAACDTPINPPGTGNRAGTGTQGASASPTASGTGDQNSVDGGITDSGGNGSNSGSTGASPTPTPSPSSGTSPTPTPDPTPTQTAPPAAALSVSIDPSSNLTIHLPPPGGATPKPTMPTSIQLTAEVTFNTGIPSTEVTWSSNNEAAATVSGSGLVTAASATGSSDIVATSADGKASASVTVDVVSFGDVNVEVE